MPIRGSVLVLAGFLCLVMASDALCAGDVMFVFGQRTLDDDAKPVEDQDVYGVNALFKVDGWPVALALGFETSESDDARRDIGPLEFEVKATLLEAYIGVGKIWDNAGTIRPFIGGGITLLGIEGERTLLLTGDNEDDDDMVFAPYVNAGVFWRIHERFNLGVGLRYVFFADATIFNEEFDVNYLQFGGLAGWGW